MRSIHEADSVKVSFAESRAYLRQAAAIFSALSFDCFFFCVLPSGTGDRSRCCTFFRALSSSRSPLSDRAGGAHVIIRDREIFCAMACFSKDDRVCAHASHCKHLPVASPWDDAILHRRIYR